MAFAPVQARAVSAAVRPLSNLIVKFLNANGSTTEVKAGLSMLVNPDGSLREPPHDYGPDVCALLARIAERLDVISQQLED